MHASTRLNSRSRSRVNISRQLLLLSFQLFHRHQIQLLTGTAMKHSKKFVILSLVWSLGLVLSCQPPDCDRPDCGTCGNACCTLELTFDATSEKVYNAYVDGLKRGGDDGRYTFKGGDDLRKYKIKADFILQGWHRTKEHHYNDTLDFTFSTMGSSCLVRAFSISQIAGAYCDAGQNYKNLIGLTKNLSMSYTEHLISGCPPPSPVFN